MRRDQRDKRIDSGRRRHISARQVILDGCCSHATYLILPIGPKLTQAEVVGRITALHNRQEMCAVRA